MKKVEETDYEPLAQLIRRIGNSREPFLVPQIGIPHGATNPLGPSALSLNFPGPPTGSAQPPFASSFPSFGTTLTADQQNKLEQRKQEEQFLMARQKEHLVQQQVFLKQMQMQGMSHGMAQQQLHHHSSAHSLQSQPSYGSIASPTGIQPSPGQMPIQPPGPLPGFFDAQMRPGPLAPGAPTDPMLSNRDFDMNTAFDRMNVGRSSGPQYQGPGQGQQDPLTHQQQVAAAMQDRARLQKEQEQADATQGAFDDRWENAERLAQFHQLRMQDSDQHIGPVGGPSHRDVIPEAQNEPLTSSDNAMAPSAFEHFKGPAPTRLEEQHLAPLQAQPAQTSAPPAPSISPLPAPAARRTRVDMADNLTAESSSRSQTPQDTPTTALAPWAKDNADHGPKGPSLKEIQEAEARKTAQREELAAAARRAQAEQERLIASQAPAPAPGLPLSANWANNNNGGSPVSSSAPNGPSAWAKPLAGKVPTPAAGQTKKTLAQIQKEEETKKKNRAAAAAATAASTASGAAAASPVAGSGGKRYANLAGKVPAPVANTAGSAWTTVGASGKAKQLAATASPVPAAASPVIRSVSGNATAANIASASLKTKAAAPTRNAVGGPVTSTAQDEFRKWIKAALGKGLSSTNLSSRPPLYPSPSSLYYIVYTDQ